METQNEDQDQARSSTVPAPVSSAVAERLRRLEAEATRGIPLVPLPGLPSNFEVAQAILNMALASGGLPELGNQLQVKYNRKGRPYLSLGAGLTDELLKMYQDWCRVEGRTPRNGRCWPARRVFLPYLAQVLARLLSGDPTACKKTLEEQGGGWDRRLHKVYSLEVWETAEMLGRGLLILCEALEREGRSADWVFALADVQIGEFRLLAGEDQASLAAPAEALKPAAEALTAGAPAPVDGVPDVPETQSLPEPQVIPGGPWGNPETLPEVLAVPEVEPAPPEDPPAEVRGFFPWLVRQGIDRPRTVWAVLAALVVLPVGSLLALVGWLGYLAGRVTG